jgi:heat shock protein HtpX
MKWFKRIGLFILTNILIMITINILIVVLSNVFGIRIGGNTYAGLMMFSLVWGMGGAFISLLMSKVMAKWMMGVQILDPQSNRPDERALIEMVNRFSQRAGIEKMPEVGIYDSPEINAFATGPSRNNSLVAVSTGLLQTMNSDEIEGVIGHEVAHIANGDMVTMTLIQGIVNAFVIFFSRILSAVIASSVEEKNRPWVQGLLHILLSIVLTILGSMVVAYFSRRREFRADAGGAQYAGRHKMIAGLEKLRRQFDQLPPENNDNMATLKISSRGGGFLALLSTHPPLEERIAKLQSL